jgi:hypothetical protein
MNNKNKKLLLDYNECENLLAEAYQALLESEKIIRLQNGNNCLQNVEDTIKNVSVFFERKWK